MMVVTGRVLKFDDLKGYGFVAPDTGGDDVFIHVNDLNFDKRLLNNGTRVEFELEDGDRGPKASNVNLSDSDGGAAPRSRSRVADEDGDCDILTAPEFLAEVTEALLDSAPSLSGEQIKAVRRSMVRVAEQHGWVEQ